MNFSDCIRTAVTNGKVSQKRGQDAIDTYDAHFRAAVASGASPLVAHNGAGFAAIDTMSKASTARKWALMNQLQKQHEISEFIGKSTNLPKDLTDFMNRQENIIQRLKGDLLAPLNTFIEKYRPKAAGLWHPIENLDDIVHASFGGTPSSPEVAALTKGVADFLENIRKRGNIEGAAIPPNPNYRLPQDHDALKLRALDLDRDVARQMWVGDMIRTLDFNLVQYAGKPILPQDRAEVLGKIFDAIITDGKINATPRKPDYGGLTTRLNQERFLYFKDADSYLEMQKKYSSKNLVEQLIGTAESRAHDIALMETMGTNPWATRDYISALVDKRSAELELQAKGNSRRITSKVEGAMHVFDARFDIHSMNVDNASEALGPKVVNTVKTLAFPALLAKMFIMNLADRAFSGYAARRLKLPGMNISYQWARAFNPANAADRLDLMASGIANESAIGAAHSAHRWFGAMDGAKFARRFSDVMYRANLATPQMQATRNANAYEVFRVWANHANVPYKDLPFMSTFREFNINEGDWDKFRSTPQFAPQSSQGWGKTGPLWLRPLDMKNLGGLDNQRVADKFSDFLHYHQRLAQPSHGTRGAVTFGGHLPAETAVGQMARTLGALKNFPLTMYHTYWRDIQYAQIPTTDKIKLTAQFMAYMFGGGIMVTQAQSLVNGYGLYDPTNSDPRAALDFYGRSIINAGILGPLGDMVSSTLQGGGDRGAFYASLVGPIADLAYDTGSLTAGNILQGIQGQDTHFEAEAIKYIQRYFPHLWYTQLLFEREFFDELLRQSDPAAYNRKVQYMQKTATDTGRDIIYPMR